MTIPLWVFTIIITAFVAWRARQMGYSSILWFIFAFLTSPLITLGFLSALPDRTIEKKRKEDMEELERQLARRGIHGQEHQNAVLPRYTISDETTMGEFVEDLSTAYSEVKNLAQNKRELTEKDDTSKVQEAEAEKPSGEIIPQTKSNNSAGVEAEKGCSGLLKRPVLTGCVGCGILTLIAAIFIIGVGFWLFSGPSGGVKLSYEMEEYALDYLETNKILESDEELIAYYDATISLNGNEAAILTTKRVIYHKSGRSTAILLKDIEDINHRYENGVGDIIEITSNSGLFMKIIIAPLNQGETFNNALMNAWERSK